jgi:hypothetical protein
MKAGQKLNRAPKSHITMRILTEFNERAERVAERQHSSLAAVITQCVEAHIGVLERMYGLQPTKNNGVTTPDSSSGPAASFGQSGLKLMVHAADPARPQYDLQVLPESVVRPMVAEDRSFFRCVSEFASIAFFPIAA